MALVSNESNWDLRYEAALEEAARRFQTEQFSALFATSAAGDPYLSVEEAPQVLADFERARGRALAQGARRKAAERRA